MISSINTAKWELLIAVLAIFFFAVIAFIIGTVLVLIIVLARSRPFEFYLPAFIIALRFVVIFTLRIFLIAIVFTTI